MAIIYGVNPVLEQILSDPGKIENISLMRGPLHGQLGRIARQARELNLRIVFVDRKTLNRLAEGGVHQGVVARIGEYQYAPLEQALNGIVPPARLVILDGVQDPMNLGAIVRTAVCAGAHAVIIPERNSAGMTASAIKASAGAAGMIPVCQVKNVSRLLEDLKKRNIWTVAIEADGEKDIRELDPTLGWALVLGNEGKGVRKLVRENCDFSARIPMRGAFNSLNVSVAAGIALFTLMSRRSE
jgi:23S rRNA (guanosine2251-2'-O)-methyltransferase